MHILRSALLAALLLPLLPIPTAAADTCDYVNKSSLAVGILRVESIGQRCRWYDIDKLARVTQRIDRVDTKGPALGAEHVVTQMLVSTETRYDDGRTNLVHRIHLAVDGARLQGDYVEWRDASGRRTCWSAGEATPHHVPGRLVIPVTSPYPACPPNLGLLP